MIPAALEVDSSREEEFTGLLDDDVGRQKFKTNEKCIYLSLRATEKGIPGAIKYMAKVVNEVHKRYGIRGFLAQFGSLRLAGRDAVINASGDKFSDADFLFPSEPVYCVFSFPWIADKKDLTEAMSWLKSIDAGGFEAAVGNKVFGLDQWE